MPADTIHTIENRKVKKTYLTSQEVSQLIAAAKKTRYSKRDTALILLAFRHGLRASEAVSILWNQIDLLSGKIYISRLKGSSDSVHVLEADEIRLLKQLQKQQPDNIFVFLSERGTAMTADNFLKLVKRLGKEAGFSFNVHPHMLRHGAGYQLVNSGTSTRQIQNFLGHKNLQHTERYTKLSAQPFMGFGKRIGGRIG